MVREPFLGVQKMVRGPIFWFTNVSAAIFWFTNHFWGFSQRVFAVFGSRTICFGSTGLFWINKVSDHRRGLSVENVFGKKSAPATHFWFMNHLFGSAGFFWFKNVSAAPFSVHEPFWGVQPTLFWFKKVSDHRRGLSVDRVFGSAGLFCMKKVSADVLQIMPQNTKNMPRGF